MTKQSHIEQLIHNLCPNGVEYKTLGELLDYEQPGKYIVKSTEYDDKYPTPVLTAGQSFILGYTDETDGIYKASKENPTIIFDDFTTSYHWVEFDFKVKSSAMKMLRPQKGVDMVFRYVYYAMLGIDYKPEEHTRQWISRYALYTIPFPPREIQEEIVRLLDTFTELLDNIDKEISERVSQFEHARDSLILSPKYDWKETTLGAIGKVCMCKRILKSQTNTTGGIPFYKIGTFGGQADAYITEETYNEYRAKYSFPKKGDILLSASGTIGRCVVFNGEPAYFQDSNIVWIDNDETQLTNRYFYYYSKVIKWVAEDGGVIKRLYNNNLRAIIIKFPSLKEQQAIAAKLDTIEAFIANLKEERDLRQKQYEYYRAKLISLLK